MIRNVALKVAGLAPARLKRWLYAHPIVAVPLSRLLRLVVPGDSATVVTIQAGPNRGMLLAMDRLTPRYYWLKGHDEPAAVEIMRDLVKPGMTVVDVGAHIGIETMMFSRWVGEQGRVISFEPDPATRSRLRRNVELNGLKNVALFPVAISDCAGQIRFAATGEVTARLIRPDESGASILVECNTLDAAVLSPDWPPPEFVKIDVEDNEVAVLKGAERLLSETRPHLLIEIHSPASLAGCVKQLRRFGYTGQPVPADPVYESALRSDSQPGDAAMTAGVTLPAFHRGHLLAIPPAAKGTNA